MLVGLSGPKGIGKSTIAKGLLDYTSDEVENPYYWYAERINFADALRKELCDVTVRPENYIKEITKLPIAANIGLIQAANDIIVLWDKPTTFYVRNLLQYWGTEIRRNVDPLYWVNKWQKSFNDLTKEAASNNHAWFIVVDDVRFKNEYNIIVDNGGVVVKIHRPGVSSSSDSHASEDFSWWDETDPSNSFDYNWPTVESETNRMELIRDLYAQLENFNRR